MTERDIFSEALLRPDAAARAAFLDEACGPSGPLRERIEQLLAFHEGDQGLFDRRPGEMLAALDEPRTARDHDTESDDVVGRLAPYLSPAARPGAIGRLGHYEILQILGVGGFGIVVKAHDETLARCVAIKILAPHMAATSPPRKRFLREARAAAAVRHEHVVQIYAVEEKPLPYLVMEFIDGQTVQERLVASGPLEPAEVARLGRQVALGLAAAHEKGLVHRDVKPENILLEAGVEDRVKLTDFGLARAADDACLTRSGIIAGSPMYMAPEQARGGVLDHRADLFSLGSVLYTMAVGRPPFRAPNAFAVLRRVVEDTPRPIREILGDVPPGLCAVIARLMEKKPEARYATAREAAEALDRCLIAPVPRDRRRFAAVAAAAALLLAIGTWAAFSPASRPPRPVGPKIPVAVPEPASHGIVVTRLADDGRPGTLRWAIAEANRRLGDDEITFDPVAFDAPRTITLDPARGPLALLDAAETTITGPAAGLTISGGDRVPVFRLGLEGPSGAAPARARIADLTVAHGRTTDEHRLGGGVLCRGESTLTMAGCTLRDNSATLYNTGGGAVFIDKSTVLLINCTLARNEGSEGGAIKNFAGVLKATNCTFVENRSEGNGGGIYTGGFGRARTELYNSLFSNPGDEDVYLRDESVVTGDHNLTADDSAPGAHSLKKVDPRLAPLGRHGGPTETCPPLPGSPALDAGDDGRLAAGLTTDQRKGPRVAHGLVDLGAVEIP